MLELKGYCLYLLQPGLVICSTNFCFFTQPSFLEPSLIAQSQSHLLFGFFCIFYLKINTFLFPWSQLCPSDTRSLTQHSVNESHSWTSPIVKGKTLRALLVSGWGVWVSLLHQRDTTGISDCFVMVLIMWKCALSGRGESITWKCVLNGDGARDIKTLLTSPPGQPRGTNSLLLWRGHPDSELRTDSVQFVKLPLILAEELLKPYPKNDSL